MKIYVFFALVMFVAVNLTAKAEDICSQLKPAKKATAFLVSNKKISNQINIGEHDFKEHLKNPVLVDVFIYPPGFTLQGDCTRSCFSVKKVKSECKGFTKYKGEIEIEPTVNGIGKFGELFQLSLIDEKADYDQGFQSFHVNVEGIFHGGSMGIFQGNRKELDDFFLSKTSSLVVTLKNFGDLPVNIGMFYVLDDGAKLATISVNSCANKLLPANATCEFAIKSISTGGFPKKNGTVLTVAFANDGLGDGNGILFFDRSDGKITLSLRQGYSQ